MDRDQMRPAPDQQLGDVHRVFEVGRPALGIPDLLGRRQASDRAQDGLELGAALRVLRLGHRREIDLVVPGELAQDVEEPDLDALDQRVGECR
jgi:hypothetical protein